MRRLHFKTETPYIFYKDSLYKQIKGIPFSLYKRSGAPQVREPSVQFQIQIQMWPTVGRKYIKCFRGVKIGRKSPWIHRQLSLNAYLRVQESCHVDMTKNRAISAYTNPGNVATLSMHFRAKMTKSWRK